LDYAEFSCRWIDKKEIWKLADDVRQKYWPEASLPVNTENIVEFRLKLNIEPKHNLFTEIDMDAYLKRDLKGIVVDYDFYLNEKFSNRMRFSFAHELGHFFLHKYIFSSFDFESSEEWRDFILNVPEKEYSGF
jgi:Zn-dependent peptidase ImmA (M78 family)